MSNQKNQLIEPPTHRLDSEGVWVHYSDLAYDRERVESEMEEMASQMEIARARLRAEIDEATKRNDIDLIGQLSLNVDRLPDVYGPRAHPMVRYYAGETRYDIHAEMRIPRAEGEPVVVRAAEYFGPDARRFHLRRLSRNVWREVRQEAFSTVASSVQSTGAKLDHQALAELAIIDQISRQKGREKAVRYGLVAVDGLNLTTEKDHQGRTMLTEASLDMLHDLDPGIIDLVAKAVLMHSEPLRENEFLHYA